MKDQSCEKKMQSLLIFDPCELLVFEGAASLALSYLLIQMWSTGSFWRWSDSRWKGYSSHGQLFAFCFSYSQMV